MKLYSFQIEQYLKSCQCEKNLSVDTLKAYRIDLQQFLSFANEHDIDADLINRYVIYLQEHFSPRSANRKFSSIRAFFQYQEERGQLENNPLNKLHIHFQLPSLHPEIVHEQIIGSILQCAYTRYQESHHRFVLRDIVVLELLFSTGARVSELCALSPDTFSLCTDRLQISIPGKGYHGRVIQITAPELLQLFSAYLREFQNSISMQNKILINNCGNALSENSVRLIIKRYSKMINTPEITPQMFRHSFAASLLNAGVGLQYIQALLGHNSITTTHTYVLSTQQQQQTLLVERKRPQSNMTDSF